VGDLAASKVLQPAGKEDAFNEMVQRARSVTRLRRAQCDKDEKPAEWSGWNGVGGVCFVARGGGPGKVAGCAAEKVDRVDHHERKVQLEGRRVAAVHVHARPDEAWLRARGQHTRTRTMHRTWLMVEVKHTVRSKS